MKDLETRQYALDGTVITVNKPLSRNATVVYELDFGFLGEAKRIGELMDIKRGCTATKTSTRTERGNQNICSPRLVYSCLTLNFCSSIVWDV